MVLAGFLAPWSVSRHIAFRAHSDGTILMPAHRPIRFYSLVEQDRTHGPRLRSQMTLGNVVNGSRPREQLAKRIVTKETNTGTSFELARGQSIQEFHILNSERFLNPLCPVSAKG